MIGFYLVQVVPQPWLGWPLLIVLSAAVTFALYEGVRRVGALRFLFGMRPARRPDTGQRRVEAAPAPTGSQAADSGATRE